MRKHVTILGWLYIVIGALGVLGALVAFGVLSGIGFLSGDFQAFGIMSLIGGLAGVYLTIVSLPNIICGVGLLRDWGGWVLILAVILGLLNLPNFPFGSVLGVYTFWVVYRVSGAGESFED